jgi:hypothetical protein
MLGMRFIAEQRAAHQPGLELLTPRDIVERLQETLPRRPEGKEALVARTNERQQRRHLESLAGVSGLRKALCLRVSMPVEDHVS